MKLAARLQHPGVVPVYDAGFWPSGEPFLVMKLVLGQSLARVIRDADTRADRLALLPHVIAAAEAVAYAHDQGIVHRDLKPSNILVGAFGETVVVDWGLAKDLRAGATADEPRRPRAGGAAPVFAGDTAAGAVVGTPSYMPPEQAAGRPGRSARRRVRAGRDPLLRARRHIAPAARRPASPRRRRPRAARSPARCRSPSSSPGCRPTCWRSSTRRWPPTPPAATRRRSSSPTI